MTRTVIALGIGAILSACGTMSKPPTAADLLVHNGTIYSCSEDFDTLSAFVVADGAVLAVGSYEELSKTYSVKEELDLQGRACYPGFIDAHAHFRNYARQKLRVDLSGTESWEECLERVAAFSQEVTDGPILGRGWDQNDWAIQEYPFNDRLNELFPDRAVALTRIDGHALIANDHALEIAGFTTETEISGGELIQKEGRLTGVCIDAASGQLRESLPEESWSALAGAMVQAEQDLFDVGLTGVMDAGLPLETISFIDSIQKAGTLKFPLSIWAQAEDEELDYYLENGVYKSEHLTVRGFKVYCDGALGSRGAYLKEPYHDRHDWRGLLITDSTRLTEIVRRVIESDFQVNTHAIGDSGNALVLSVYGQVLEKDNDRRWRIEHAQVVTPSDYESFAAFEVIPSVQPTHATSDMYWAEDRLGAERIAHAYAYSDLLDIHGWMPLGTDFPVEDINPKWTFYAAVFRQDVQGFPEGGFQLENGLSRREALMGMTLWAAKSGFWEESRGSLEVGKRADFIVPSTDWMVADPSALAESNINLTYLKGVRVH